MGAWGDGNLESDGALDALADICDELFGRVMELLQHPRAHEYDDEEIDELFVRIEMIFALSEKGMVKSAPAPEELEVLFDPYLQRWAEYQRESGDEFPHGREKVIRASFQRLMEIARAYSAWRL
ncbi:DUF4259 domain-containing protein [Luteolibacter sp. GHJ8]|uniref:DUF4259 domain-containing protein n=1 Tax=Luteolibacter rhizosphaerae TaxID=2989719 RepID=A0ABT3G8S0_9BACT|nr:DUF4259 domain-containing protein [Luteolibacter rhizosphaerae]MCW1916242.1 DUF4259 domain-containing protein [Luteolibacter rhizosphaerae]